MVSRRAVIAGIGGIILIGVAIGGFYLLALGGNFQSPELESIESEFGTATEETTEVRTQVVIDNPNDQAIPGTTRLRYTVYLNDIRMGQKSTGIDLQPGENTVELTTRLDNEQIPAWWVSHINNGEETTLSLRPSVSISVAPVDADLPAQNSTIRTDLLGALNGDGNRTVAISNTTILEISDQEAEWGEATMEETPIVVRSELENRHDEPVRLDGTEYRIVMNGVVVGEGLTNDSFTLGPGETGTYTVRPVIETPRMQAWWVEHIQRNETTALQIEVYGLVRDDGELKRVPLTIYARNAQVQTDLLDSGETTIETRPTEGDDLDFEEPRVVDSQSRWGEAGEEHTEIISTVTVRNPNDGEIGDITQLNVSQTTVINRVEAARGAETLDGLESGNNTLTLQSRLDHDTVPRWWARHLNNGERSSVVTQTNGTADVGVTALDFETDDRERSIETSTLDSFNSTEDQTVEQDGQTILVVTETSATWGEATPQEAPINTAVTIENRQPQAITIRDITYTVALNGVKLADNKTVDESYTIAPATTQTITPTFVLNTQRTAEWWPTHVRNGERSTLSVEIVLTVESALGEKRVRLDPVSGDSTVETDIFED